jgi:hypothetical protein
MAIFNSELLVYQRVIELISPIKMRKKGQHKKNLTQGMVLTHSNIMTPPCPMCSRNFNFKGDAGARDSAKPYTFKVRFSDAQ